MDGEFIYGAEYRGRKDFDDPEVRSRAGNFGAASENYADRGIDLNEQLIKNKPSTFFFRMKSDAMTGAGIHHGDVLIVDRSIKTANGKVVIAVLDGEMLVRRFEKNFNKVRLIPETSKLGPIEVDPYCEFAVWGVVTYVIHSV